MLDPPGVLRDLARAVLIEEMLFAGGAQRSKDVVKKHNNKRGFSLAEGLVLVAIWKLPSLKLPIFCEQSAIWEIKP